MNCRMNSLRLVLVAYTSMGVTGEYMKEQIVDYMKKNNLPASIKYIDPSYMIRSVPANAADALCVLTTSLSFCLQSDQTYDAFEERANVLCSEM